MKKFFAVLALVFLSVVGVYGQRIEVSVGLPIGVNIDNYSRKVDIVFDGANPRVTSFDYLPAMGDLKSVIEARVRKMADTFSAIPGLEQEQYAIFAVMYPGPLVYQNFIPQKSGSSWTVPPEVLDVRLNYSANVGWYIDGVAVVEMDIVTATGTEHFSSEQNYSSDAFSACYLGALQSSLKRGATVIKSRYVVPSLQKENGVLPGSTLTLRESDRNHYTTISLMDGSVIGYSFPPPAFLKFPDPKLEIAKTADGFELSVTGVVDKSFVIESTTDFVTWDKYPAVELTSVAVGKKSFSAKPLGASRFFRLRIEGATPLGR